MDNVKHTIVDNAQYGVWCWELPNGRLLSDGEGNYLSLNGLKDDLRCMMKLRRAAASYGYAQGKPVFKVGKRKVTDSEWEDQMERMKNGDIADPLDPAIFDEARAAYERRYTNRQR